MTTSVITALLASTIRQGVPILFPAVGETVAERAGVMNIGLEGNMVIGAFTTLLAYQSHSRCSSQFWPVRWPDASRPLSSPTSASRAISRRPSSALCSTFSPPV